MFLPYPGRLVGIDYGTKNIGIAVSDSEQTTALPKVILASGDFVALHALLKEVHAVGLVIGFPSTFSGKVQKIGHQTRHFIAECEEQFHLPVFVVDERLTSKQVKNLLPSKKSIDDVAAAFILQTYLDAVHREFLQKKQRLV